MTETAFIAREDFRKVLGSYPTGVCVITALDLSKRPLGMVVGSFTSVSLDPPLVGFFPDKKSTSWPQIEAAGYFCVNVLSRDQQSICRALSVKGSDKFAGIDYTISNNNMPILADAIASIECRLHGVVEAGDHWFVMGKVLRLDSTREENPMVFHRGRYGCFAEVL